MIQNLKTLIFECLNLLWMIFFRRTSFERQVEQVSRQEIINLIIISFFLSAVTPYLITILIGLVLKAFGITFGFASSLLQVERNVMRSFVISVGAGIFGGAASGVARGVAFGVASGVALGVLGGIVLGIAGGVMWNLSEDVGRLSIAGGVPFDIAIGVAIGVTFGVSIGVPRGTARNNVVLGVALGVAFGVVLGVLGSFAVGITRGVAVSVSFTLGFLRLPFIFIEFPTTLWALAQTRFNPKSARRALQYSLAFWDELTRYPQPLLSKLIVAVGKLDDQAAREAIDHLMSNTLQKRVAQKAFIELASNELLKYQSAAEIAESASSSYSADSMATIDESITAKQILLMYQRISGDIKTAVSSSSNYNKLAAFERAKRLLEEIRSKNIFFSLSSTESQTFSIIAQQWLRVINSEIDQLTAKIIASNNIPNPYKSPGPLEPGSKVFIGREDVTCYIEEHFLREDESSPIVLFGQPRIGKSSLLRNLILSTNLIPVYVDMLRSAQVESTAGLLFNLSNEICKALTIRGLRANQPKQSDFSSEPFIVFDNFLDEIERVVETDSSDYRFILALDEFEEIEKKLSEGQVSKDLMPFLRSMMQQRRGIRLLFAGTHTLDEMIDELWAPYFRSAVPCRVSYLSDYNARKLITNPIMEFPLDYDQDAVDYLIEQTHRHPCLIQLTCSALVDLKNQQKSRHATVDDVKQSLSRALEMGDYVFRGIWDWIPVNERNLLALISMTQPAQGDQLGSQLEIPDSKIRGMIVRLTDAEVLESVDGGVRFQVELFRRWVEKYAVRKGMEFNQNNT